MAERYLLIITHAKGDEDRANAAFASNRMRRRKGGASRLRVREGGANRNARSNGLFTPPVPVVRSPTCAPSPIRA